GFIMLYLMGFDLLTGVFMLTPLALLDRRPGVTVAGILRNWGWVFLGNFAGALTVAVMMAFVFTYGFSIEDGEVGERISHIGENRVDSLHPVRPYVQLDGIAELGRRPELDRLRRQGHRHVDAYHAVLLHALRALGSEHVPVPLLHDHGRRLLGDGLHDLERDS